MNQQLRAARLAVLLALTSGALAACQALAGIEDRKYDPVDSGAEAGSAGSNASGPSAQCTRYCTLAKQVCQGKNTLYTIEDDNATCLATCALMKPGIAAEPQAANTVACRVNQLLLAQQPETEPGTIPDFCASAGPGGNGTCGTSCESYCQLFAAACMADFPQAIQAQYDQAQCVAKCSGLADTDRFDVQANYTGDTLQCRLVHISAALGTVDGLMTHCPHAQLQAQTHADPAMPCIDDPATPVTDCDAFCQLEMAECSGQFAVYESRAQCLDVCKVLKPGTVGDTLENTVGCRKYHSYNAMAQPEVHCPHTGPGGDGHCGSSDDPSTKTTTGNCESYCLLLETACGATVTGLDPASTFQGNFANQKACTQACGLVPGAGPTQGYAVTPEPKGDSVQCRLLHVSRALAKPLTECAAALGGTPCK